MGCAKPQDSEVNGREKDEERTSARARARKREGGERRREGEMQWVNKSYVEQMAGAAIS